MCADTQTCAHVCRYISLCSCVQIHRPVHMCEDTQVCAQVCTCTNPCTCVQIHKPMHRCADTRVCVHVYRYTSLAQVCRYTDLCTCKQIHKPVHRCTDTRIRVHVCRHTSLCTGVQTHKSVYMHAPAILRIRRTHSELPGDLCRSVIPGSSSRNHQQAPGPSPPHCSHALSPAHEWALLLALSLPLGPERCYHEFPLNLGLFGCILRGLGCGNGLLDQVCVAFCEVACDHINPTPVLWKL